MGITERFFQFGSELNVIHLPYRPNGFCIFILGGQNPLCQPGLKLLART